MHKISFKNSLLKSGSGDVGLIAEVKLASPSEGDLGEEADVLKRVEIYQIAGVDAISVITEKKRFKGDPKLVSMIKNAVDLPILQKDFIVSKSQIEESQKIGADALLLIARIINAKKLAKFVSFCREKGIEPVVEIFNLDELAYAVESGTEIIAVNARDLETFKVDVDRACAILKQIPNKFIKLGFSGVRSWADVEKYQQAGAKAVLVGTELMKAKNIGKKIKELKNASFS